MQPYLQGYLAVDSLWLYHRNKGVIGAQQPIATGPVVVDKSSIDDLTQYISEASAELNGHHETLRSAR